MAGNFEIDEDGLVKAEIGIRGVLGRKDRIQNLVNKAARAAMVTMKLNVPNSKHYTSTGGFQRAIGMSKAEFRPGGLGGGGVWTAVVGVERTAETTKDGHSYPLNVFQGTGIFGPRGRVIKAAPGNVMVIQGRSRTVDRSRGIAFGVGHLDSGPPGVIFTRTVEGQLPQREWYNEGRDRAQLIISSNLHRVYNVNDPMDDI